MLKQKKPKKFIVQSCTSRECKKKFKDEITDLCEAVTTLHIYLSKSKKLKCSICGKITKISN